MHGSWKFRPTSTHTEGESTPTRRDNLKEEMRALIREMVQLGELSPPESFRLARSKIINLRGIERISYKKPIISSFPLSDIMQAVDNDQKKSVMVSADVHRRIVALRKGGQTYGDVVASSIQALEELIFEYGSIGTLSVELPSLGRYTIRKPIQFQLSYDIEDAVWCLENDELALNGYGSTYQRTIECLEECVEGHVLFFTDFPESKHTEEGLRIKKKLQEYLDFDQVLSYLNERDEEN